MALIDTGLGWWAEETWLTRIAGTILGKESSIGGNGLKTPPGCTTTADLASVGITQSTIIYGTRVVRDLWAPYDTFPVTFAYFTDNGDIKSLAISPVNESGNIASCLIDDDGPWAFRRLTTNIRDQQTGLYYMVYSTVDPAYVTSGMAIFASLRAALDAVVITNTTYTKLNAGYAVACIAKWASLAGDYITSPVLISSNRDAVVLSDDGENPIADQMISSHLYNGIWFHMSFLNLREKTFTNVNVPEPDLSQFGAAQPAKVFLLLANESYANIYVGNPPDPYGGESEEEGGEGEETETAPIIEDVHSVPGGGGFYHVFTPSLAQCQSLSYYMWGPLFDLNNIKRLYADPMDVILGFGIVPVSLSGVSQEVYIAGVGTGISMPEVADEIIDLNLGYIQVKEKWGCYLDYEPYTKFSIYLPFIGYRDLATDDIMKETITLKYRIDIVTGACVARISRSDGTTLYQFSGQCMKQLPITSANWDNALTGAISAAVSLGAAAASGGTTAPVLAGAIASSATQALAMKPNIERSGSLSGSAALMGGYKPFLIRTQPRQIIPGQQNKFIGYPAFITKRLGDIHGYNEISSVHLENIPATGGELAEIETLLKGGVIL